MAEAGGSAAGGAGPSEIDGQIQRMEGRLSKVEQAIDAIHAARRECRVLPEYKTEDAQDVTLERLEEKDKDLRGMLRDLITQQTQAQAQAGEEV
jgi:hypothetical protein